MHRIYFANLILFLCLCFCLPQLAAAQESEIDVEYSVEYAFGQELRFLVDIKNATGVEKLTLSIHPEFSDKVYLINIPFDKGESVSVVHSLNVKDVNLRPYSKVYYFWEIQTAEGKKTYPEEEFEYEDDRFVWQAMTREGVTAHWTGSGPFFGQDVLSIVIESLDSLASILPLEEISPFSIYVYPSSADLRAGLRLAGLAGESTSHPELGVILVTAVNPQTALADLGQSLPYEITQLLLFRTTGEHFNNFPWWLIEGLATTVQLQSHPRYTQLLDEAVKSGTLIPILQLCQKTERIGDRNLLASAQSNSLIGFIKHRYGEKALADLVAAYVLGDECEIGVRRVIGISLLQLEDEWVKSLEPESSFSRLISDYGIWILLILAGTLIMVLIIWLNNRGIRYHRS